MDEQIIETPVIWDVIMVSCNVFATLVSWSIDDVLMLETMMNFHRRDAINVIL